MKRFLLLIILAGVVAGCTTKPRSDLLQYGAYGFFEPVPGDGGEFIGAFATKAQCEDAATLWASRQVAGTAISTACYETSQD